MLRLAGSNSSPLLAEAARPSRLVAALEALTVAACLALGVAFVGSLLPQPPAPEATTRTACPVGSATPC